MNKDNKLKIVHVILSKGFAGSEKYVIDLINFQKKNNFVYALTSNKNTILNKSLKKNIKIFEIGDFFKKFQIKKILNNISPDIVHTHLGESAKLVGKSINYKTISTMHMNYKNKDYKNSDAIIVSNKSQLNEIKKTYSGKLFKSYLWVNLPKINISKSKLIKKLNIPKNNIIFGSIGRFHFQKGFDILIECFTELSLKNCTLVLIGNGHHKYKRLEAQNRNFKIIGHVNNVSNFYNIFDICIFASRWETFGYGLVEAMKFNKPIISSKHIGNKDWINNFNIYKFNINRKNELKKLIKKVYYSKILKKKYDLNIFKYKENCKLITSFYHKVLDRSD